MSHATSKFILEEKLTYLRVKDNWTLGDWSHLAENRPYSAIFVQTEGDRLDEVEDLAAKNSRNS